METTTQPILAMEVGTWVRIKEQANSNYAGFIGVIAEKSRSTNSNDVWVKVQHKDYESTTELIMNPSDLEVLEDQESADNQQMLETWERRYRAYKERYERVLNDFDVLCEAIMTAADNAGYCDEYDNVVKEVNETMDARKTMLRLTEREKDFYVNVEMYTTVYFSDRVLVRATSEDAAEDMVRDDPESYLSESLSDLVSEAAANTYSWDYEISEVTVD